LVDSEPKNQARSESLDGGDVRHAAEFTHDLQARGTELMASRNCGIQSLPLCGRNQGFPDGVSLPRAVQ
jgi:hypothetical protein